MHNIIFELDLKVKWIIHLNEFHHSSIRLKVHCIVHKIIWQNQRNTSTFSHPPQKLTAIVRKLNDVWSLTHAGLTARNIHPFVPFSRTELQCVRNGVNCFRRGKGVSEWINENAAGWCGPRHLLVQSSVTSHKFSSSKQSVREIDLGKLIQPQSHITYIYIYTFWNTFPHLAYSHVITLHDAHCSLDIIVYQAKTTQTKYTITYTHTYTCRNFRRTSRMIRSLIVN